MPDHITLAILILFVAALYSSVGHAGASGYLAAMALMGVAPDVMKPSALVLNIVVAVIATARFAWAGHFSWRLFLPFAVASVPLAVVGGYITLPGGIYKKLVGVALVIAALRFLSDPRGPAPGTTRPPPLPAALGWGAGIGLLSGLTGVGGGIYLTPLMLLMRWAQTRQAAAVSAAFILVNSVAGLAGHLSGGKTVPSVVPLWIIAAVAGGLIGSHLGSGRLPVPALRRVLAIVLVIASVKLFLT